MKDDLASPLTALRIGLTATFLYFGITKLFGTEPAVSLYEAIGLGQWMRYVTGSVETLGALALWIPGYQGVAALVLTGTMALGLAAMLVLVGGAWGHLALLLVFSALTAYGYRRQITRRIGRA